MGSMEFDNDIAPSLFEPNIDSIWMCIKDHATLSSLELLT